MEKTIIKTFLEKNTGQYYKTLSAARKAHPYPYVVRIWVDEDGHILGEYLLFAYGDRCGTITRADKEIETKLKCGKQ